MGATQGTALTYEFLCLFVAKNSGCSRRGREVRLGYWIEPVVLVAGGSVFVSQATTLSW